MSFVDDCLSDHIDRMIKQKDAADREIEKLMAKSDTLSVVIEDLQFGIKNWQEEAESANHLAWGYIEDRL